MVEYASRRVSEKEIDHNQRRGEPRRDTRKRVIKTQEARELLSGDFTRTFWSGFFIGVSAALVSTGLVWVVLH